MNFTYMSLADVLWTKAGVQTRLDVEIQKAQYVQAAEGISNGGHHQHCKIQIQNVGEIFHSF